MLRQIVLQLQCHYHDDAIPGAEGRQQSATPMNALRYSIAAARPFFRLRAHRAHRSDFRLPKPPCPPASPTLGKVEHLSRSSPASRRTPVGWSKLARDRSAGVCIGDNTPHRRDALYQAQQPQVSAEATCFRRHRTTSTFGKVVRPASERSPLVQRPE